MPSFVAIAQRRYSSCHGFTFFGVVHKKLNKFFLKIYSCTTNEIDEFKILNFYTDKKINSMFILTCSLVLVRRKYLEIGVRVS